VIRIANGAVESANGDLFSVNVDTLTQDVLMGAQSVLAARGYSLLTKVVDLSTPLNEIDIFDRSKIDGAIFVGGLISDEFCRIVQKSFVPAVYAFSRHRDFDFVDTDPEKGMYLAVRHLIEHGHRRIALVNGVESSQSSLLKLAGYQRALEEADIPFEAPLVRNAEFNGQGGFDAMRDIWTRGIRPTAVIGGADSITLGLYRYLYSIGINYPRDISIVGYETSILTAYSTPRLTSVCLERPRIGAEAAQVLLDRLRDYRAAPVQKIVEPWLMDGESVRNL